MTDFVKWDAET